ncbi:hypothetical protein TNCT_234781 [Trichonephila clavata]|uniref:Uncharacterized protein n=1 Tax=Trichonephila clavata TaxID=2740835 RepID=A0A8X6IWF5_TRICU|nr:hypothetical protein TNCT_234781 [Trichonephila clavata]
MIKKRKKEGFGCKGKCDQNDKTKIHPSIKGKRSNLPLGVKSIPILLVVVLVQLRKRVVGLMKSRKWHLLENLWEDYTRGIVKELVSRHD